MPSSITHYLVAQKAKENFPEEIARAAAECDDYYFLGAQGPDALFFFRPLSNRKPNLGRLLHNAHVQKLFCFFRDYLSRIEDKTQRMRLISYMAGYLSHYAADVVFHPFVYNYLKEHKSKKPVHQLIENDWDVYFLREYMDRGTENFPFPLSADKIIEEETLAKLFYSFGIVLTEPIRSDKFNQSIRNFERYLLHFHKHCDRRRKRWRRAEKLLGMQPRVSYLFPRRDPDSAYLDGKNFERLSEGRAKNADDLFNLAVRETARLVKIFFDASNGAPLLGRDFNRSFHTGKQLDQA